MGCSPQRQRDGSTNCSSELRTSCASYSAGTATEDRVSLAFSPDHPHQTRDGQWRLQIPTLDSSGSKWATAASERDRHTRFTGWWIHAHAALRETATADSWMLAIRGLAAILPLTLVLDRYASGRQRPSTAQSEDEQKERHDDDGSDDCGPSDDAPRPVRPPRAAGPPGRPTVQTLGIALRGRWRQRRERRHRHS